MKTVLFPFLFGISFINANDYLEELPDDSIVKKTCREHSDNYLCRKLNELLRCVAQSHNSDPLIRMYCDFDKSLPGLPLFIAANICGPNISCQESKDEKKRIHDTMERLQKSSVQP